MEPLISIVIPTLNSEKYLKECFDSVVKQSYKNLEVIVVDGGSTDNTQSIANSYCSDFDKWKIIITSKGVSHQRNVGKENSKGEFLFFLDSDDYISPKFIEKLYKKLIDENLDFVTPSICCVDYDDNKKVGENLLKPTIIKNVNKDNFFDEEYDSFLAGPTKLYRCDSIKSILFPEDLSYGEDLIFNYEIVKRKPIKYDICDDAVYYYRHDIKVTNPVAKRMNKSGYLYCVKMVNITKEVKPKTKNYCGAFNLLKTHVLLYMKECVQNHKMIPLILLKPRLYLFFHTKRKLRYYYIFPRTFNFIKRLSKNK